MSLVELAIVIQSLFVVFSCLGWSLSGVDNVSEQICDVVFIIVYVICSFDVLLRPVDISALQQSLNDCIVVSNIVRLQTNDLLVVKYAFLEPPLSCVQISQLEMVESLLRLKFDDLSVAVDCFLVLLFVCQNDSIVVVRSPVLIVHFEVALEVMVGKDIATHFIKQ
jgi:hypothetical protein